MNLRKFYEDEMRVLWAALASISVGAYADIPSGLIGGQTSDSGSYAASVFSSGEISSISGLSGATSQLNAVSMNETGVGLIGGYDADSNGYAAFVSADGTVTPLSISFSAGSVYSTSINTSGAGLVGGNAGGYAAAIATDGTVTSFGLSVGFINSVSLNDSGVGLIGGEGSLQLYAAYVTLDGTVSAIPDFSTTEASAFNSVAVNSSGDGIVGGFLYLPDPSAYAAFVAYNDGSPTDPVVLDIETNGTIYSVAINDSGLGLIGGNDGSGNVYAAYAASDTTITTLLDSSFAGSIQSVALNTSGVGLIGGYNASSDLYAAFVQSDGTVTPISLGSISGEIYSVALSDAGVGLIGGYDASGGYAALVAPNGTVTVLNVSNESSINSVALNDVVSSVTPQESGPYFSAFYTQLAAVSALDAHLIEQNRNWIRMKGTEVAQLDLAYNETDFAAAKLVSKKQGTPQAPKKNSIWLAPFGDFVYLQDQGAVPNYSNEIGGALLGYDYTSSDYVLGASLGYAFDYVHYSDSLGHAKLQEEMACFYGSVYANHFRFTGALWGGLTQLSNVRHSSSITTSTGKTNGWILDPHVELATPWAMDSKGLYLIEPFAQFDWINNWQDSFTESGASGFNLKMGNLYGSFLQSEAGLRFYEQFQYGWGNFNLEEKLSYVNQAPFHLNTTTTSFVGSASTFSIAVGSTKIENLCAVQLTGSFVPKNNAYPFGGFSMQTTANGSYQAYFVSLFSGINF